MNARITRREIGNAIGSVIITSCSFVGPRDVRRVDHTTFPKERLMSQAKIDPYTWPHKMLRRLLFDAALRSGSVDFESVADMHELKEVLLRTLRVVDGHAEHEATFLHPVIVTRLPELVREFDAAHEKSLAEVEELRQLLGNAVDNENSGHRKQATFDFYRALGRFTAAYLQHIDEEEAALPRYWSQFSDDELGEVMRRFNASRSPSEAMSDLERMFPALAPAEQRELLTNVRASAPPEAFRAACNVARRTLDDRAWDKLRACVAVP
jgi:hypothetical protein